MCCDSSRVRRTLLNPLQPPTSRVKPAPPGPDHTEGRSIQLERAGVTEQSKFSRERDALFLYLSWYLHRKGIPRSLTVTTLDKKKITSVHRK